jgi:nuclear transport factor 2 (NTF2) superfamily protein
MHPPTTKENEMPSVEATIHRYVDSWNDPDPAERRRVIDEIWSTDGVYRNASTEFEGSDGIEQAVTAAHNAFVANAYRFQVASVQINHDAVRYQWEMVPAAGGEPDSLGTHVAMLGTDGRLISDHQFIDKAPSTVQ